MGGEKSGSFVKARAFDERIESVARADVYARVRRKKKLKKKESQFPVDCRINDKPRKTRG